MYELAVEENFWQRRKEASQIIALAGLFLMIAILECVSSETAKRIVWYLAAVETILLIISLLICIKAEKLHKKYAQVQKERMKNIEQDWK